MSKDPIKLTVINQSSTPSQILIYQNNVVPTFDPYAVAWHVTPVLNPGGSYGFTYDQDYQVSCIDSYGNITPRCAARPGQSFKMVASPAGSELASNGQSPLADEVQVVNDLTQGAIQANLYRGTKLLARKDGLVPGQSVAFKFDPTIWLGVASGVEEGQVMDTATQASANTELSLLGVASADIVMTGGGPGPNATPYSFTLQNVTFT